MKKNILVFISVILSITLLLSSCGNSEEREKKERRENLKIGLIVSGDETDAYSALHIEGVDKLVSATGIKEKQLIKKTNVTQKNCYEIANELIEQGCNLIFSVGNDLEDYIVQAATENTDVHFCVAKGKQATTTELDNMHSYSVAESESRYVSGVVAGMKLNDMINNGEISSSNIKIGYVGTTRNAENTSSYTAFYLGVKSVCPGVNLEVQYSGLEHSENLERIAANALIANGCILIAQHSYTNGAAETCEKNNVYFVGNITAEKEKAPNFSLVSSSANWADCYTYAANCIINGKTLPIEWSNSYDVGGCRITEINEDAFTSKDIFSECKSKVLETENALKEKKLNIFNTATWTVDGKIVETTASDDLLEYYNGVEYIIDGNFKEYESSSLPKFMFRIDGIEELN